MVDGENRFNFLFLAMANWRLGNEAVARKWYDKVIALPANSKVGVIDRQLLYDIYLEAVQTMGIEAIEF